MRKNLHINIFLLSLQYLPRRRCLLRHREKVGPECWTIRLDNTGDVAAGEDYIYGKGVYHALCSLTI